MKKDLTVYPYFGKKNTVAEAIWQRFGMTGGEYFEPPKKEHSRKRSGLPTRGGTRIFQDGDR